MSIINLRFIPLLLSFFWVISGYGQCAPVASGGTAITENSSLTFTLNADCNDCVACNNPNSWLVSIPATGSVDIGGTVTAGPTILNVAGSAALTIQFLGEGNFDVSWEWGPAVGGCMPSCTFGGIVVPVTVTVSCAATTANWTPTTLCPTDAPIDLNTLLNMFTTTGGTWSGTGVTGSMFDPAGLSGDYNITYTVGTGSCISTQSDDMSVTGGGLPTASNPAPVTVSCPADVPPVDITVVTDEADDSGTPVVAYVGDVSDGNTCPEIITRTYSVTDDCSNSINVTQIITIHDLTLPTAPSPTGISVECVGDIPFPNPAVVVGEMDNCPGALSVTFAGDVSNGMTCPETFTRTYDLEDICGNSAPITQIITVNDVTPPTVVATTLTPGSVECVADIPAADPTLVVGEADNCTAIPTVIHLGDVSDGMTCPETITRTYQVSDDCNNTVNVTQVFTVNNLTPPTAPNPVTTNVDCITNVPAVDINVVVGEVDNCGGIPSVAFLSQVSDGMTCPETLTRTYRISDGCGLTSDVLHTIVVNDNIAPVVPALAAINVQCIGDVPAANITDVIGETDNCTVVPTVTFVSDVSDGMTCPETITRTYNITDDCNNTTVITQSIIVNDNTLPTADALAPIDVQCAADISAPNIADVTGVADNCTAAPVVAFVNDISDGATCPETIIRIYSITDDCNNVFNLTQTITVDDDTPPTASNPAPITVSCPGDAPVDVTAVIDEADNCTAVPLVSFVNDVSDGMTCPETITRTYQISDDCGNAINVTQIITVDDDIAPTASNPAPTGGACIGDVPIDPTVVTDEADNCVGAITVAFVSDVSDGGICPEIITRTYSVTDLCGNSINVEQTITLVDNISPTASNPLPVSVVCIEDVPLPDPTVVTDEADNCTTPPTVAFVSDVSDGMTCPETITRTYSVTDPCGNSINVEQTITINDITPPTASNPLPITVACIGDVPLPDETVVTDEADNCAAAITVTFVSDVSDGGMCPEILTRTYNVADACGNSIDVTQTITVNDDVPPTASNPLTMNIECIADAVVDNSVVTDENDNCLGVPTVTFVGDVSDGMTCPETLTRTYAVTDVCSNVTNVDQIIVVNDITPPTASNPVLVNVQCIGDVPAPDVLVVTDEADNCVGAIAVAFVGDVSDGATCPETITRTYSMTDLCGNVGFTTQTIIVNDDTPPTASNPLPVTVQCAADAVAIDLSVVTDEADNCTAVPIVTFAGDVSDGATCPETITRSFDITDDCGNVTTVTQIITVDDNTFPTASNPIDIAVQCLADVPAPDPTVITDEADNCTAVPMVAFVSDVSDGGTCPEVITRTYSVTDDCGNAINLTHEITINDDTAPTASNPIGIVVDCLTDVPVANGVATVTSAFDNCGIAAINHIGDVSDGAVCAGETITRTYEVIDACNNSTTVDQLITITTIPPVVGAGMDLTVCEGDMITLTAENVSGGIISWDKGVVDGVAFEPPLGFTTYTVTSSLCGGVCTSTDQVVISVNPLPNLNFVGDTLVACDPFVVDFANNTTFSDQCTWDFGDGTIVNDCGNQAHNYNGAGDYEVNLTVTSDAGCTSTSVNNPLIDDVVVTIIEPPVADFIASTYLVDDYNVEIEFTNNSTGANEYEWDFRDGTPLTSTPEPTHIYSNDVEATYDVRLVAIENTPSPTCNDTAYASILVKDFVIMYVPNAVTIDGNGLNSEFQPVIRSGVDYYDYHMTIFNRWGEIVFESFNYDYGWDGAFGNNGIVQDGVYVWLIDFKETGTDERQEFRGHVTVLR